MAQDKSNKYQLRQQDKLAEAKSLIRKNLLRRAVMLVLGILVLGGAGFAMVALVSSSDSDLLLSSEVSETDRVKGAQSSQIILVEYSDFQCPACGAYYPLIKRLSEEFSDQIQIVYRHFPLPQHPQARPAAYAAEAAGGQGKFWEMHDLIFENQSAWSNKRNASEIFEGYASQLGLDMEKFRVDVDSDDLKDKVSNDYKSGIASGVNSTPTFFLNGRQLQNPRSYDEFRNIIINAFSNL